MIDRYKSGVLLQGSTYIIHIIIQGPCVLNAWKSFQVHRVVSHASTYSMYRLKIRSSTIIMYIQYISYNIYLYVGTYVCTYRYIYTYTQHVRMYNVIRTYMYVCTVLTYVCGHAMSIKKLLGVMLNVTHSCPNYDRLQIFLII